MRKPSQDGIPRAEIGMKMKWRNQHLLKHKMFSEPFSSLACWETFIDIQLFLVSIFAIITVISAKMKGEEQMWLDILINVGCSAITSIVLSVFIYFKFLRRIPNETKSSIERLLNDRLGYETGNHNAALQALNPNNAHLSLEHHEINTLIQKTNEYFIRQDERNKSGYELLENNQKLVVDSIHNLAPISEMLLELKQENAELKLKNAELKREIQKFRKEIAQFRSPVRRAQPNRGQEHDEMER